MTPRIDIPAMRADWCDECGTRHSAAQRQAVLQRLGNLTPREVWERNQSLCEHLWPYPRKLERDLAALRARNIWPNRIERLPDEVCARIRQLSRRGLKPLAISALVRVHRLRVAWLLHEQRRKNHREHRPNKYRWPA